MALGAATLLKRPDLVDGMRRIVEAMQRSGSEEYLSFLGFRAAFWAEPSSCRGVVDDAPSVGDNVYIRSRRGAVASRREVPDVMPHYAAIRNFLSLHHGYYCEACLATRLDLPAEEIRRSARQRTPAEVTIAYRLCQSCLHEKGVFALRTCA